MNACAERSRSNRQRILLLLVLSLGLFLAACGGPRQQPERVTLRIAVLPILDALPLYVAQEQGYFAEQNLTVEFVPVSSAAERDQIMAAGQADGMINDIVSTLFYNSDQTRIVVVRFARTATPRYPQYRILAAANSGISTVEDLKGVEIGISDATVIEYTTDRLLEAEGFRPEEIRTIAVPRIPDRMALLNSGELKAANLPDPLALLAIQSGAVVIIDDASYPEYGNSVLSFRKEVVDATPEAIRGFLAALEQAVNEVNADKGRWDQLLSDQQLVPAPLIDAYEVPDFPTASVPTEAQWIDVVSWAQSKGLIAGDVAYAQSVDSSYLP